MWLGLIIAPVLKPDVLYNLVLPSVVVTAARGADHPIRSGRIVSSSAEAKWIITHSRVKVS